MSAQELETSANGAKAALDGFEYQLNVSIFAALRLMLITKSATQVTLEPANDEDLEADLDPSAPGRVQTGANTIGGYKLVIQVKLRKTEPWSLTSFNALLNHGKKRRLARDHLDDPDTRYLLITSADTKGKARNLMVGGLEEWPETQNFPKSLLKTLQHAPEGRVAIWGVLTERTLELEIDDILGTLLRVPKIMRAECRAKLRSEALSKMRGTDPGIWSQEDLLNIIRSFDGYLASAPLLEAFVPPANYDHLKDTLAGKNAVVIKGPSGTGKTLAALALLDHARQGPTAPEVIHVNVTDGPSSTRALSDSGPKLFYIEDPWGQYSLRGGADIWTEQLPRVLRAARAEHQYIITSRSDMLGQAKADTSLERWSVVLDADQYRDGQLATIYDKRLDQLAPELQAKAVDFRKDALDALETPYEIDLFFMHLTDGPEVGERDHSMFHRIKALAHRDAVEDVVVSYLETNTQTGAPAIVWGLLAARTQFDRLQLAALSRQLRTLDPALADSLEKLVNRMVATRHLRQPNQKVSFSHPSVKAGFEKFIKKHTGTSEAVLKLLVDALAQVEGSQQAWSIETAVRSLNVIRGLLTRGNDAGFVVDPVTSSAIDTWLEQSLVDPKADFRSVLQLASDVGTQDSTPSELARWFIKGIRRGGQFFMKKWAPPKFNDAWYVRVSSDPRSFTIADRFVREQLPWDSDGYRGNFAEKLERISQDLTPAFISAANKMVGSGFNGNVSVIAAGAVRDLPGYEPVLDAALNELARVNSFFEGEGREEWRAIQDGERDDAHEEGYQSHYEDDGYAAGVFVETFVMHIRSFGRWKELSSHPRVSEMAHTWAGDICKPSGQITFEEMRAVLELTYGTGEEAQAWEAARMHWIADLTPSLQERILSNPDDDGLRETLAYCAILKSPETLKQCFEGVAKVPASLIQLVVDLREASHRCSKKERKRLLKPILKNVPDGGVEVFKALSKKKKPPKAVGEKALSLLGDAANTLRSSALGKIVPVMIQSGASPSDVIRRWLHGTTDDQLSRAAAKAAIAIKDDGLVWNALKHSRAGAREEALGYLVQGLADPLPSEILNLAFDPGCRVRRALVASLTGRLHADHYDILLRLIHDNWSDSAPRYNELPSHPIAREAIVRLAEYKTLTTEIGRALVQLAEKTDDRSLGITALNTAAQCCGPEVRVDIWALSFNEVLRWVRVDAIDALVCADVVENCILNEVSAELILRRAAPLAASTSALLAVHGQMETVTKVMERIAHSRKRRALLLIGAVGLNDRNEGVARGLLDLLESDHPSRKILDLAEDEKLPATALDDLGDIRIRRAVQEWLDGQIEKT